MNSAATLAQLGAVLIMTMCRALVRPGFPRYFIKAKLLEGYEIDWLAWKLVVSHPNKRFPSDSKNNVDGPEEHASLGSWAIGVGGEQKYPPFGPPDTQLESEAQRLLTTSRGLYKLAGFHRSTTPIAINLALAIEATLNALFPPAENERTTYRWYVNVDFKVATTQEETEQNTEKVWFDLVNDGSSWRAPADCLNAALSLWTYTAQQRKGNSAQFEAQECTPLGKYHDDSWLRSRLPPSGLRLLGPTNDRLFQDLKWWAPESLVFEVQQNVGNTADPGTKQETPKEANLKEGSDASVRFKEIEKARVVGQGEYMNKSDLNSSIWKISTIDREVHVDELTPASRSNARKHLAAKGKHPSTLAIETSDPMEVLYVKDLLFCFFYSAAKTLRNPISGITRLRPSDTKVNSAAERSFSNDSLTKLVQTYTALGFGHENEVLPSIVTPLSMAEMLPFPKVMFDLVSSEAVKPKDRYSGDHQVKALHALVRQASSHAYDSTGIWESCLAFVAEAAHIFETDFKSGRWWSSYDTPEEPDLFRRLLSFVPSDLLDTRLLAHLRTMYLKQGRQEMAVVSHGMTFDHPPYDLWLRATALHELAIRDPKNDPGSSAECHFELINEQDASNWTPLHCAAASGNLWFVELLRDSGASVDPELKDYRGYTALHCAFEQGNLEIIQFLIDFGFGIDVQGFDGATPIHLAAKRGNTQALNCVFDDDWKHRKYDSARQQMKSAKRLEDANGRVPLHWAAMAGEAESLAKSGEDINATDYRGRTPLHLATMFHQPEAIRSLCDLSADTNKIDHAFETALSIACAENQLEAVKILLGAGANPEVPTWVGHRSLHMAAVSGRTSIMRELLDANADVSAESNSGATPLHEAAQGLHPEATKLILELKANPDAKTKKGETPIIYMLRRTTQYDEAEVLETLRCLVDAGANPSLEDKNGIKPISIAKEKGFSRVVEYLRDYKKE
ncbi:ankyrin repeat [Fusarium subglutinans]|uniref:Ankyrin repeat n=1 Tax=Gibberella subglutinans TaxID=42677 RepID=A0A8H5V8C9_GIBSU|nr:ankyrin repeat [Fusarium subglutinans]KAF5611959.1 ankyrin repeat [Fusarium subglutinans]